jgi:hypothetical protein
VTPQHQAVANFVATRVTVGRVSPTGAYTALPWVRQYVPAVPTPQALAEEFLADAGYRALELGTWLSTPTGEFLAEAVSLAVPSTLAPEFDLIVAALTIAAKRQQGESWVQIGKGLGAVAIGGLAMVALSRLE